MISTAQIVVVVGVLVGVAGRTALPYLLKLKANPDTKFDRKFLVPAVTSFLINLVVLPLVIGSTTAGVTTFLGGYLAGWAVQDMVDSVINFSSGSTK